MNRTRLPGPSTAMLLACSLACSAAAGPPEGPASHQTGGHQTGGHHTVSHQTAGQQPLVRPTGCPCGVNAMPAKANPVGQLAGNPMMAWPGQGNPYYRPLPPVAPPPGTLGRTYQLRSRPVPVDKHPRVAMIDVHVANAVEVTVRGTNDYRTEDTLEGFQDEEDPTVWRFESKPLIPGLPHIYEVEVEYDTPEGTRTRTLYVRLIMGRIVQLKI